jgi:hypothetical protein
MSEPIASTTQITVPTFHLSVLTWTIVVAVVAVIAFLFVHESNQNAIAAAQAKQAIETAKTQTESINAQIQAIHEDTAKQVAAIQTQMSQVNTVAQAIASIKTTVPSVTLTPIVTTPATASSPAITTAALSASGNVPVATISGNDLKLIADSELQCKQQSVELTGCQKQQALDQQQIADDKTEITTLKKVKVQSTFHKVIVTVGQIALGVLIGHVL